MVDLSSLGLGSVIPSTSSIVSSTSSLFLWITILIFVCAILLGGVIGVWFLIRYWQFNKKILIFEDRGSRVDYIGMDRAREVVYNQYGDSVFYLKSRKKYLPRGEMKVAKNTFVYIIRQDGEWVNGSLESLNNKLKEINVNPIHPDMRAFKSGMGRLIKDRFEKKSFLKEYGHIILPLIVFVICGLVLYFIADKLVSFLDKMPQVLDAAAKVQDKTQQILVAVNNVCPAQAGIK